MNYEEKELRIEQEQCRNCGKWYVKGTRCNCKIKYVCNKCGKVYEQNNCPKHGSAYMEAK